MNSFPLKLIAQFDGVEGGGQRSLSLTEEKQSWQKAPYCSFAHPAL